jgi:hypothetical protein
MNEEIAKRLMEMSLGQLMELTELLVYVIEDFGMLPEEYEDAWRKGMS